MPLPGLPIVRTQHKQASRATHWGPEAVSSDLAAAVEWAVLGLLSARALKELNGQAPNEAGERLRRGLAAIQASTGKKQAGRLLRLLATLDGIHGLLVSGRHASPRELYYTNVQLFQRQQQSDDQLKWLCRVLQVPRHHLRLAGTAKGLVRGHLRIFEPRDGAEGVWIDGMDPLEPSGHPISPLCAHLVRLESMARTVLVVEKETVFHRLLGEGFLERHRPCVLVTARGFPDLATRHFLCRLLQDCAAPSVFALVDFDASGLVIAATYALGKEDSWCQEDLSIPDLMPIVCPGGASGAGRFGLSPGDTMPLTTRDHAVGQGLLKRLARHQPEGDSAAPGVRALREAAASLLEGGVKYELDALAGLSDLVTAAFRSNWRGDG